MGAIYGPSLRDLQKVLRRNDKEMRKVGEKMSEAVLVGPQRGPLFVSKDNGS
jgi:hypothetical protein